MTDAHVKHFPRPTPETRIYWDRCREHELLIQRCMQCHQFQFYPRIFCTACMSEQLEWVKAAGSGRVLTFTIVRRAVSEAYVTDVPYVVALIQLDEGPTLMSNVVQCEPEAVEIGSRVEVVFEDWSEDISIPQFRLVSTAEAVKS